MLRLRDTVPLITPPSSAEPRATLGQRVAWAILIALTLYVCYFSHLDVIGFVGPDEPRYAWIARDMAESGDWVTPRLYGRPWFEKPPLLYWGGAIFFKLLGEERPEIAARLPSAISALLATLALARLAWRTYSEECARWLLLLLPTSVGMIGFSHACATDMPFAGMLTLALVCAAFVLGLVPPTENTAILPRTPWLTLLLFGFFLGLAVLAKGPAGIILVGGAVFFWALFTKRWRDALRLLHPAAIAAFCLTALPWYILCARRNPDFFRIFIIEHNFKRYLTPEFQHIQPFWFYGPVLLVALLPWIGALLGVLALGLERFRQRNRFGPITILLVAWSIFCVLFFTVSKSKLPGYILPTIPALGLLIARACVFAASERSTFFRYCAIGTAVALALTAGAMSVVAAITAHTSYSTSSLAFCLCIVGFLFAVSNGFLWISASTGGRLPILSWLIAAGLVAPIVIGMLWLSSLFKFTAFWDPSSKVIARDIFANRIPPSELTVHSVTRGIHFGLNFYLKSEIPDWDPSRPRYGYLLLGSKNCAQVVSSTTACEEPPLYLERSGRFLYRVAPDDLFGGPGSGRQPQ